MSQTNDDERRTVVMMRTENHRQTDESHYNNDTQYLWYLSTVSMVVIYAAVVAITLKRQAW